MKLFITDADNTLWDWHTVFSNSLLEVLASVEEQAGLPFDVILSGQDRLTVMRLIDDQLLLDCGLDKVSYPRVNLVYATLEVLRGKSIEEATRKANRGQVYTNLVDVDKIASRFVVNILGKTPRLYDGVFETLDRIKRLGYTIVVASESDPYRCQRLLDKYNISKYIDGVYTGNKSQGLLKEVLKNYNCDTKIMVGDRLVRDIKPAKELGMTTIYIKPPYIPLSDRNESIEPDYTITDYRQITDILMK